MGLINCKIQISQKRAIPLPLNRNASILCVPTAYITDTMIYRGIAEIALNSCFLPKIYTFVNSAELAGNHGPY